MTNEKFDILFSLLKDINCELKLMSGRINKLERFADYVIGGFWVITTLGSLCYFLLKVINII